jgi:hypothetical protein
LNAKPKEMQDKLNTLLDIYVPSLQLAFEYQGEQHYRETSLYGSPEEQKERDLTKRGICRDAGIFLIEIPYWWNFDASRYRVSIGR